MKNLSMLTVVGGALCMCINASAAIGFHDDDTECVVSLTRNTTSTPGTYEILLHLENYGADNAMMYRTSAWVIGWPSVGLNFIVLRLSSPDAHPLDSAEAMGIGTVFNRNRTFTGTAAISGSLSDDDVNTSLIMGIQYNLQPYLPTPGTVSIIGLAGIVAMRRRR